MEMGPKTMLLMVFAIVAAWFTGSVAGTCDTSHCLSEKHKISEDNHAESCRIFGNLVECFDVAFADCRTNFTTEEVAERQKLLTEFRNQLHKKCGGSGAVSGKASVVLMLLYSVGRLFF